MTVSFIIRGKFFKQGLGDDAGEMFVLANQVAMEAFGNIRTIASFSLDQPISALYDSYIRGPTKAAMKKAVGKKP